MMNKLTAQGNNQNKQFKPKIYKGKWRGQSRNYYDQGNYQNRYRLNSGDRRTSLRGRGQYGQNYSGRPQYVNVYMNDFRRDNVRRTQNYRGKNFRGGYRSNNRNDNFGRGRSRSRGKNIQAILAQMIEVVVGQDQVQEPVLTETELDVLSVGNMIILLEAVQIHKQKQSQNKYNKCII